MRDAETVLGIIRERGRRGLPLEDVYRQLYNPELYLRAYGRLARNHGALTPGATAETADGMSLARIDAIIEALRHERYRWTPVRRVAIPKSTGKTRPLGIPTWSDKLVQEVIRSILEAYYEPQFSDHSHGFRPSRGCHTALSEIYYTWRGTQWFIEADITQCFERLDHTILLTILGERLHDQRFLRLIKGMLGAGYLEDWKLHATLSGSPQGGVASPILANIYLDRLDHFVDTVLLANYTRGTHRAVNPLYARIRSSQRRAERSGDLDRKAALARVARHLPSRLPSDPNYRRLRYVRYADDFLLGFCGPRSEAEEIKRQLGVFLQDELKLELSETKTRITPARREAARFLGYDIVIIHDDAARTRTGQRISGAIGLKVPVGVIQNKCKPYMRGGKPVHRTERIDDSDYSIVAQFQAEYRGLVEYYRLAFNLHRLRRVRWIMEQALVKTLARKHRTSVSKIYAKYSVHAHTHIGPQHWLRVKMEREGKRPLVSEWGGISLARNVRAVLDDKPRRVWNVQTDLEQRLRADRCEQCGSRERVEVHHVRALKDLRRQGRAPKPTWVQTMAARQRKTLVVCRKCHEDIQYGRCPRRQSAKQDTGEPGAVKAASPVRREAVGKGPQQRDLVGGPPYRAMGRLAESAQRLTRGGRVLVVGRLDISHYQSRDGEPRTGFDVWADEVVNLAAGRSTGEEPEPDVVGAGSASRSAGSTVGQDLPDEGDLPF